MFAASAALLAAGCGGGEDAPEPTPQEQVRTTWRAAAGEAAAGDGEALCARITEAGRERIRAETKLPCEDAVRLLASRLSEAEREAVRSAPITQVTVTGERAVVGYESTAALRKVGFTGRTELEKSGGQWLLSGI